MALILTVQSTLHVLHIKPENRHGWMVTTWPIIYTLYWQSFSKTLTSTLQCSVYCRKLPVPCLSVCHVKCPQNWSFFLKKKQKTCYKSSAVVTTWTDVGHDASPLSPSGFYHSLTWLLYLIISAVSAENDIPQRASDFYLWCSLYMQGWVTLTNASPVFSISHAALDCYEWGGWKTTEPH